MHWFSHWLLFIIISYSLIEPRYRFVSYVYRPPPHLLSKQFRQYDNQYKMLKMRNRMGLRTRKSLSTRMKLSAMAGPACPALSLLLSSRGSTGPRLSSPVSPPATSYWQFSLQIILTWFFFRLWGFDLFPCLLKRIAAYSKSFYILLPRKRR